VADRVAGSLDRLIIPQFPLEGIAERGILARQLKHELAFGFLENGELHVPMEKGVIYKGCGLKKLCRIPILFPFGTVIDFAIINPPFAFCAGTPAKAFPAVQRLGFGAAEYGCTSADKPLDQGMNPDDARTSRTVVPLCHCSAGA